MRAASIVDADADDRWPALLRGIAAAAIAAAGCSAATIAAAGCSAAADEAPREPATASGLAVERQREPAAAILDVEPSDVAILYPLVDRAAGYLTPASAGRGGPLIPPDVYARAFGSELRLGGTPAAPALAGLRLVGIRVDPCFAALPPVDDARCTNQLRLVFQHVDGAVAADEAVHAFYALERRELVAAVTELAAIRGGRTLGPAAPHPLLVAEGLDGPAAHAIARVVLRYAGTANLTRITAFTSSGLGTAWNFFGVDVDHGATAPVAIATLPGVQLEAFFAGFVDGELTGDPAFTPASTQLAPRDDLRRIATRGASAADRERALDAARRIEDPAVHSPDTIDCVSCHVAHAVQSPGQVNVHMFGYKGRAPSIQPRTQREIDATVAYMRRLPVR